jgi:hypothetical protein
MVCMLTGLESNQRTRGSKPRCPCQQSTGHQEPSPGVEPGEPAIQRATGPRPGGRGSGTQRGAGFPPAGPSRAASVLGRIPTATADALNVVPPAVGLRGHEESVLPTLTRRSLASFGPDADAAAFLLQLLHEPQRGFEPRTPPLRGACSDQLSYRGIATRAGIEPACS